MQKIFHNILVPLSLNKRTELNMSKAIEFANQLECHLHFLFNLQPAPFPWNARKKMETDRARIHELKEKFQKTIKRRLKLFFQVKTNDVVDQISTYAGSHEIDIVLLDSYVQRTGLLQESPEPAKLASHINCPVLSLGHFPDVQPFKTIVLPVENEVPVNKIRIAVCLAKQFESSIHLVVLEKNGSANRELACMQRVFELLKNNTDINVTCTTLQGKSLKDAALYYSQSVKGSLIAMNTTNEIPVSGWMSRLSSLFSSKGVAVPVITVA